MSPRPEHAGTVPHAEGALRQRFIFTMAHFFEVLGYENIRARVPGILPPFEIEGIHTNQRPDLTCVQVFAERTPRERRMGLILDVVTPAVLRDLQGLAQRLELFSHTARATNAEFHVCVPQWTVKSPPTPGQQVRAFARDLGCRIAKVWEV